MAHSQQQNFCKRIVNQFPEMFNGGLDGIGGSKRVLDCGSLSVNGDNKWMFPHCKYIGIDLGGGLNVDVVSATHEYNEPNESFDAIISTECFEHDMFYEKSLKNIVRLLKSGGIFVFTCATTGRPEHGTRNTTAYAAPLLSGEWADYYKNLTEKDIRKTINVDKIFDSYAFTVSNEGGMDDLYFWGIKK